MGGNLAIQNILAGNAGVQAITEKIFYDEADQAEPTPFVIVRLDGIEPQDNKDGVSTFDFDNVVVVCFGGTVLEAHQLAVASRDALDRTGTNTYNGIDVDSIRFITQRSASEFIDNKITRINEQVYQVITRP